MAHDKHLREKANYLRTEKHMTLDEIIERLSLPKTTIYGWIKDIPIPRTNRQNEAQQKGTLMMQAKFAAIREQAYRQGREEAPELLKDFRFRDFVVLYTAEGYRRNRNTVSFGNSDPKMISLAHDWICRLTNSKIAYQLQIHEDHDEVELQQFWGDLLGVEPDKIKISRKSNSNQLKGRNFRSVYGVLSIKTDDTYFRARLQAWMDFIKEQW
jgi:hypothetical protein